MEPKIIEKDEMVIVGISDKGPDIRELWERFLAVEESIKNRVEDTAYELHFHPEGEHNWQDVTVMVGVQVTKVENLPSGTVTETLQFSKYALFTHQLANGGFEGANDRMNSWLETGPYRLARDLSIQVFDSRFMGPDNPESEIDFLLPIVPKQ